MCTYCHTRHTARIMEHGRESYGNKSGKDIFHHKNHAKHSDFFDIVILFMSDCLRGTKQRSSCYGTSGIHCIDIRNDHRQCYPADKKPLITQIKFKACKHLLCGSVFEFNIKDFNESVIPLRKTVKIRIHIKLDFVIFSRFYCVHIIL